MSGTKKTTSRRVGLHPGKVADAALELTRERGLDGWSVRDLATALDVAPSVIYHYYPTKDGIRGAVCERVCAQLTLPDEDLPWQVWFIALLLDLRSTMLEHHGVAHHVIGLGHAGTPPQTLLPVFEAAVRRLQDAGFGTSTAMAYAMIVNVAFSTIDGRDQQSEKSARRHDIPAMVAGLAPVMEQSPDVARMRDDFLVHLYGEEGEETSVTYYRLILQSLLDGLVHVVLPRAEHG